jgi:hypothetical protein
MLKGQSFARSRGTTAVGVVLEKIKKLVQIRPDRLVNAILDDAWRRLIVVLVCPIPAPLDA